MRKQKTTQPIIEGRPLTIEECEAVSGGSEENFSLGITEYFIGGGLSGVLHGMAVGAAVNGTMKVG